MALLALDLLAGIVKRKGGRKGGGDGKKDRTIRRRAHVYRSCPSLQRRGKGGEKGGEEVGKEDSRSKTVRCSRLAWRSDQWRGREGEEGKGEEASCESYLSHLSYCYSIKKKGKRRKGENRGKKREHHDTGRR